MWWTLPTYFDFTWALITVTRTGRPDLSQQDEKLVINQPLPVEYLQKVKGLLEKTLLTTCLNNQPGQHFLTSCKVPIDTSRTFFDTNSNCL